MSETEHHVGKLKVIPRLENETLEEQCRRILLDNYEEDYIDTEMLLCNSECYEDFLFIDCFDLDEKYIRVNGIVYEIYDHTETDEDEFIIIPNEDGTLLFKGSFYNGGTCLFEMLEEAIEKIQKNENM